VPAPGAGSRPEPAPAPGRRRALAALFVTVLLDLLGFGMILPLLPFYAQTLGASVVQIGILFGAFSFAQFFCAPAIGWLSDRFGRRPVLLASIAGGLGSYLLMAAAPGLGRWGWAALLAARLGAGATAANFSVAPAYIADVLPPAERARGMGLLGAAFGLGFVLGPAIGGALGLLGHAAVALGAAALAAVNLALAAAWLPETLPGEGGGGKRGRAAPAAPRGAADRRAVGGLVVLFFLTTFCFSLMESTLALFAQERFGFGQRQTSWLFVLIGVVLVAVQGGAVGRLSRRFGERRLFLAGVTLLALALAALPEPARLSGFAGVACLLAAGIALANPPAMALLTRVAAVHSQGATMGISHSVGSLARIFGPLAGTWLFAHAGPAWPFRTGGALMAAALAFGVVVMRWVAGASGAAAAAGPGADRPAEPAGGAIEPR
jgi:MFS family permease